VSNANEKHQQRKVLEEAEESTVPEENGMQERGRGGMALQVKV